MKKVPLMLFNGEAIPGVAPEYTFDGQQLVNDARNAYGQFVGQKVNRRMVKFNNLVFPHLTLEQVVWLHNKVENFEVNVTYFDTKENDIITRKFYFGDMSEQPLKYDYSEIVAKPIEFINVKVNIIDMGY